MIRRSRAAETEVSYELVMTFLSFSHRSWMPITNDEKTDFDLTKAIPNTFQKKYLLDATQQTN